MLEASTPLNISGNSVSTSTRIGSSPPPLRNFPFSSPKSSTAFAGLRKRPLRIRRVFEQAGDRVTRLGAHFNPMFNAGLVHHHAPRGILRDGVVKPEFFNHL